MNILCSDKTGTLTLNAMELQPQTPSFMAGVGQREALVLAALTTAWRDPPQGAIDRLVLSNADLDECDRYVQLAATPFDAAAKCSAATVAAADGGVFRVVKGAPRAVAKLCECAPCSCYYMRPAGASGQPT